jgi:hypothetical protein
VPAERELSLRELLARGQAQLVEPRRFGGGERLEGEVAERGAAPQQERTPENLDARLAAGFLRLGDEALEAEGVHLLVLDGEGVTAALRDEYAAAECPTRE